MMKDYKFLTLSFQLAFIFNHSYVRDLSSQIMSIIQKMDFYQEKLIHGGLGLTEVTPLTNQGLLIQFFDFLIADVFLHEIYRAS